MKKSRAIVILLVGVVSALAADHRGEFSPLPGEKWCGGRVVDCCATPCGVDHPVQRSLHAIDPEANQAQPLLLSNAGHYVWSKEPFGFNFADGQLHLSHATAEWQIGSGGKPLAEAFRAASRKFPGTAHLALNTRPTPAIFVVTAPEFGAIGDERTVCTAALQKAVDVCHASGGGRVVVPAGTFRTGTLVLKDGVELRLEKGAALQGSGDWRDFPLLRPAFRSRHDANGYAAIIYAEKASNVAITGPGIIDGNNQSWKFHPELKAGGDEDGRPRNILLVSCSRVWVEGITLRNPVMWNQHYLDCTDVTVDGITVFSHGRPNNDAIDIDGCRRFVLTNSTMDSDDDGLTIKSSGAAGCEDVFVSNCVFRSHTNAIKTGTESTGGFRNISIVNCAVKPSEGPPSAFTNATRKGIAGITGITLSNVDGGTMENIQISDITMEGSQSAIFVRLGKRNRSHIKGSPRPTHESVMRNVQITNVVAKGTGDVGCFVLGLPGNPIRNLTLANISVESMGGISVAEVPAEPEEKLNAYPQPTSWGVAPAYGFFIRNAENVTVDGLTLSTKTPDARPPLSLVEVKTIAMRRISAAHNVDTPVVTKKNVSDATMDNPAP